MSGTLHALQWLADANFNAASYDGYGGIPVTLSASQTLSGQDIHLDACQSARIEGTVALAAGYTLGGRSLRAFYPSSTSLLLEFEDGLALPPAYGWGTFTADGLAYRVTAFADDATNAFSEAWRVSTGAGTLDVAIPAAPVLASGPWTSLFKEGATLSWSAFPGAVYDLRLSPATVGTGPTLRIVTGATTFAVPDLASIGFAWPRATAYRVDLSAFAPRTPDDVAAGEEQPSDEYDGSYAIAAAQAFTTAP